jgi:hypothetical protein
LLRTLFLAVFAVLLATGCSGYRNIEVPDSEGEWASEELIGSHPERMYTRRAESKYVIKEEPYSLKSKKKDPELLGPQRTYHSEDSSRTRTTRTETRRNHTGGMTKASCISMIGEAKYNRYVKKYGGEKGALRRCLIIKRLKG